MLGVTLSEPQARRARERVEAAGVADRVQIEVADYRDLVGSYEVVASIGMGEVPASRGIEKPLVTAGDDVVTPTILGLPYCTQFFSGIRSSSSNMGRSSWSVPLTRM